ncbi:MAG: DUF4373 domain-containing protein [Ruminococcus sp.]|nr:DUF4373 domain-containing protein [Ruminococcus sp.]
MARPIREGLLYFPFDTDFFQDKKIRALKGRYGTDGLAVYIYLLCEIYKAGYYIVSDDDLILCLADDLNISEGSARQIISFLLSRSLLTEIKGDKLAKSDTVLTAASVQRRYQEAVKGLRRDVCVKAEYWLLEPEDTLSIIKTCSENNKSGKNEGKSGKNGSKSGKNPTNKIKENTIKEKENNLSVDRGVFLTDKQLCELQSLSSVGSVETYISKLYEWQKTNGKRCRDPFSTIKKWIAEDNAKYRKPSSAAEPSFDLDRFEDYANNLDLSKIKLGSREEEIK